jgi:hypothetical protein
MWNSGEASFGRIYLVGLAQIFYVKQIVVQFLRYSLVWSFISARVTWDVS